MINSDAGGGGFRPGDGYDYGYDDDRVSCISRLTKSLSVTRDSILRAGAATMTQRNSVDLSLTRWFRVLGTGSGQLPPQQISSSGSFGSYVQ